MINLKDNIWIEEFDTNALLKSRSEIQFIGERTIYAGKTSEIPEEILNNVACKIIEGKGNEKLEFKGEWVNYQYLDRYCATAKESIQSACNEEYCIIYKK